MKKYQGMNWLMKTGLVLLLTLTATVFMYEGWYKPKLAAAAAAQVTAWTFINDTNPNTLTPNVTSATNYTAGGTPGTNRIMLVAVSFSTTTTGVTMTGALNSITASYGGQPATKIIGGDDGSAAGRGIVWLGYIKDADIPAGANSVVVTGTVTGTNVTDVKIACSTYSGIDQNTPFTDSKWSQTTASATTGTAVSLNYGIGDYPIIFANDNVASSTTTVTYTPAKYTTAATSSTTLGGAVAARITTIPAAAVSAESTNVTCSTAGRIGLIAASLKAAPVATGGTLAVSTTAQSVGEAVGNATITVNRTGGTTGQVTVDYATGDGSALAGQDYSARNGTLTWNDGDATAKTITVPITNDTYDEGNENFTVTLTNATNGATLGTATQTVTITDDDSTPTIGFSSGASSGNNQTTPAVINVTLSAASGLATSVNYATSNGTATSGSDYTATSGTLNIPALSTSGTINVPILPASDGGTFTITLSSPTNATLGTNPHVYTITAGLAANITSCAGCHGYKSPLAFTDGASRNDNGNFQGSHNGHVQGSGMLCSACHVAPAGETAADYKHADGTVQIAGTIAGGTYGKASFITANNFDPRTCSNTTCHGTGDSPIWGNNTTNDTCTKCHGTPSASPASALKQAPTVPATAAHFQHMSSALPRIGKRITACGECHENVVALNTAGHMDGTKTIQFNGPVSNANGTSTTTSCATNWCHGGNTTSIPQNRPTARTAPVWGTTFGTTSNIGDALGASSTNTGSGRCAKCHGFPPATSSHAGTSLAGAKTCNSCHDNLTTAGTFVDPSKHINGMIEGGSCIGCHETGGTGVVNGRAASASQFALQSHHVQGAELPLKEVHCAKCHWESDASGNMDPAYHSSTPGKGVSLIVWNSATRPASATSATLVSYTTNGSRQQISKLNAVCLGCHNATAKTGANLFGTYGTDQYAPEPSMVPALTKTSIAARYSDTGTTPWSNYAFTNSSGNTVQYGTNQKKQVTKALSAHGNAINNEFPNWVETVNGTGEDENMVDVASTTAKTNNLKNVMCYDCHNSHGSDASGITSSYSSATGRYKGGLLKSTIANQGGYTVTYKPAARTIQYKSYSTTATHAATFNAGASICNDCHNTDTRKADIATITKPWSITGTYSSTKAIVGYWSTPYFDNYTFASAKRTVYKQGGAVGTIKDLRKPMGGHYGSSVTLGNYSGASHSGEINGLCTPCHDPHGVSSAMTAVKRGQSVPLLKGTWVTSPYREDKATPTVYRGGGRNYPAQAAMGAMPGYNIDQNTLINLPAVTAGGGSNLVTAQSAKRAQSFTAFPGAAGNALGLHTEKTPADFAGLCIGCHNQNSLTNTTAPAASNWKSKERVHQSVAGWAATTGTNANGTVHAFTCSKCHAPHVSRLPRLMITNCLDIRHVKRAVSGGSVTATTPSTTPGFAFGNVLQSYASSAKGAGRFPGGGARYTGTPSSAQNNGPWYFMTAEGPGNFTANSVANYGSNCHNATNAGGATYDPTKQMWNNRTRW